jgi:hypothetical protein
MSNIINFPKEKIIQKENLPKDFNEIKVSVDGMKYAHIQETVSVIIPMIFQQLSVAGFDIIDDDDEQTSLKDGAFLVEAIRSILHKYYELPHPFQKISDSVFTIQDNGVLLVADELCLSLKDSLEESE